MFSSLVAVEALASIKHLAFSCDSPLNATAGDNVFSATNIARVGKPGCGDCPGDANVSSCWEAPAAVWARLKTLPAGRRAITFEGSQSMYYCQTANGTRWWMDTLADGSKNPCAGDARRIARRQRGECLCMCAYNVHQGIRESSGGRRDFMHDGIRGAADFENAYRKIRKNTDAFKFCPDSKNDKF